MRSDMNEACQIVYNSNPSVGTVGPGRNSIRSIHQCPCSQQHLVQIGTSAPVPAKVNKENKNPVK